MISTITIDLSPETVEFLNKPHNGDGGFQNFLRDLARRVHAKDLFGSSLELRGEDLERLQRYCGSYGGGGFQGRLRPLLMDVRRAAQLVNASTYPRGGARDV